MLDDLLPTLAAPDTDEALTLLETLVQWLLSSGVRIVIILLVATLATVVASWLLRRFFRTMSESSTKLTSMAGAMVKRDPRLQKAAQARREQRTETLSNVARNLTRAVIWMVAIVMILSEVGVNIAPVIASLGVIGLAAGIGAQTIIKDFVAGVVILFEDIVAVGDVVDLEYATGTVEGINLRVTQVRALDGVLWTVRNGEIIRIGNMSRGYSNAMVVLDIDSGADNAKVTEVLERTASAFAGDPDWESTVIGTPDVSGILSVDGASFQRRIIIQVAPGTQWDAEQELRRRIQTAFQDAGIGFALPRIADITKA